MSDVRQHYDTLLGSVYSWILGDFDTARARSAALFDRLGLGPENGALAVDLGAGPGCQSIPLAERGFDVVAVDFCETLLDELKAHPGGERVETVLADITEFRRHLSSAPELIVCMGDTLVHLPDRRAAEQLLVDAAEALADGGSLVISIRDYDAPGPTGADRFLPIRSTDDMIFTCFLEYEDDVVHVHDILQRLDDGVWTLSVSGYDKQRLGLGWVAGVLESAGMQVAAPFEAGGLWVLHARK